jgi:hypothetical protein
VEPDPELRLEDARSLWEGLWRMAQLAQDAAETLDERIEDEHAATTCPTVRSCTPKCRSMTQS